MSIKKNLDRQGELREIRRKSKRRGNRVKVLEYQINSGGYDERVFVEIWPPSLHKGDGFKYEVKKTDNSRQIKTSTHSDGKSAWKAARRRAETYEKRLDNEGKPERRGKGGIIRT